MLSLHQIFYSFQFACLRFTLALSAVPPANGAALLYPDGSFYRGETNAQFQRHGKGAMHSADGTVQPMGQWRKGDLIIAAAAEAGPAAPAASAPLAAAAPAAAAAVAVAAPVASAAVSSLRRIPWRGDVYEGELNAQQRPHGQGALFRVNGTERARGAWIDGRLHGLARWTSSDSSVSEGEFVEGVLSGLGIKWTADGKIVKCGLWENGKFFAKRPVPLVKISVGTHLTAASELLLLPRRPHWARGRCD